MAWKEVMDLKDLQEKKRCTSIVDGHKILLIWHQDKIYAMQSQCPHLKLPLKNGTITDDGTIICPFHKSEFDIASGKTNCWSVWPPGIGPLLGKISKPRNLEIYQTRVSEGKISVEIN